MDADLRLFFYVYGLRIFLPIVMAFLITHLYMKFSGLYDICAEYEEAEKREKQREIFVARKKFYDDLYTEVREFKEKVFLKQYYKFSINDFYLLNTCNIYSENSKLSNFHEKDGKMYCVEHNFKTNDELIWEFSHMGDVAETFGFHDYTIDLPTTQEAAEYLFLDFKLKR